MPVGKRVPNPALTSMTIKVGPLGRIFGRYGRTTYHMSAREAASYTERNSKRKTRKRIRVYDE